MRINKMSHTFNILCDKVASTCDLTSIFIFTQVISNNHLNHIKTQDVFKPVDT